jgi:hypothetical protein
MSEINQRTQEESNHKLFSIYENQELIKAIYSRLLHKEERCIWDADSVLLGRCLEALKGITK